MDYKILIDPYAARQGDLPAGWEPQVRAWTKVCHDRTLRNRGLWIDYDATRDTSRWVCVERKRPFTVRRMSDLSIVTASKTLEGALKLAMKYMRDLEG